MAKSTSQKPRASEQKSPASFSENEMMTTASSAINPSKYAPGQSLIPEDTGADEDGLMKLLLSCIKDIYWAEKQLVKALPKMANAASAKKLQKAILDHLQQTNMQVERLEQVFEILGRTPQAQKCDAMEGLTKEGEGVIESTIQGTAARDLGIIFSGQKVEHYEIAAYTGMIGLASQLGMVDVADILSQTLQEEQESDELLANIADEIFSQPGKKRK